MKSGLFAFVVLGTTAAAANPVSHSTSSPNGELKLTAAMDESGTFTYALDANDHKRIAHSTLGLDFGPAGSIR